MKKLLLFVSIVLANFAFAVAESDSLTWPRELISGKYTTTLYQPQYDSFEGQSLEGRMAFSVQVNEDKPLFGAMWFNAKIATDKDNRVVYLERIDILKVNFPEVEDDEKIEKFKKYIETEIENWDIQMSQDQFVAALNTLELEHKTDANLNNAPPQIIYKKEPTVLISIDGDPITQKEESGKFEYVVNTAFFIVKETGDSYWYLKGGDLWYRSKEITTGWDQTNDVPKDIKKFAEQNESKEKEEQEEREEEEDFEAAPPKVVIATKPSELIVINGKPEYATIKDTRLLYVKNTESDIIVEITSQDHYTLIAGRWYTSNDLEVGNWKFVEPSDLPKEFATIPEDSDMGNVRASIPGTDEAQNALLEQSIPQTAEVDINKTTDVSYDGEPKFEAIEGTSMKYAVNTSKSVLLIDGKYYLIEDAVWYVSNSAKGPWKVSTERPDEVDNIPPESPVYNVKYVYVYSHTPTVVYVGYLPGYTFSYTYGGVVVYGTGYYYRPWYAHYYYPRPVTYGFGVHYNPWTGWGFHVGFSYGWMGWGFHPYYRGCWGPRGYHHGYRHGYHRGYHHGYRSGYRAGYRAAQYNNRRNNVYQNRSGVKTATKRPASRPSNGNSNTKARPSQKPNNVYSDKQGNVYSREKDGNWKQQNNRPSTQPSQRPNTPSTRPTQPSQPSTKPNTPSTRPTQPSTQPSTRPSQPSQPSTRPTQPSQNQRQQLDRSQQGRSQGYQNYQNYRSGGGSRSTPSRSMPRSGGGGRRR